MKAWLAQHRQALGLALQRLAANRLDTLLAALAVGIALALPAGGQMLLANALQLARNVSATPQLSVFMALDAEPKTILEVENKLRGNAGVAGLRRVPRSETLARMKKNEGLRDVIEALPGNPFPEAFVVTPRDESPAAMEPLRKEFAKLPKVEHVQLDSAWVSRLDALLRLGRIAVWLLAALFGVGLVAITFNTIRLQVLTQRAEIEVSRLLGATDAFIRRPFYYHGALQGISGGLVAWAIVSVAALALQAPVAEIARLYAFDFSLELPPVGQGLQLLGVAAALGWLGSALSIGRHLGD
jgi:cell division transport system permease protein